MKDDVDIIVMVHVFSHEERMTAQVASAVRHIF